MAELTKEWLKQTIAEYEANRDELPFGLDTNSAIELQAFKLALASLEAEPVSQTYKLNELTGNSPVIPDGWISCSERMPDSNCLYLCWGTYFEGDEPDYIPAYFFVHKTNGWTEWQPVEDDCNPREVIITHWMPLPAAPKQEVK